MDYWPFKLYEYNLQQYRRFSRSKPWKDFKKSLCGLKTPERLLRLAEYRDSNAIWNGEAFVLSTAVAVQISSYINLLKRQGLLNAKLEVIR